MGFPKLSGKSGFQLIKGVDFENAYKAGSISFEDDGIYLEYNGRKYKGYMFIQQAYITYNNGPVKMPRFHTMKCEKIREFLEDGRFKSRYEFSNSSRNNLIDIQTKKRYDNEVLELCTFCRQEYAETIADTQEFEQLLDKDEYKSDILEVDLFGYVRGKEKISKLYREKMSYTCESCGVQAKNRGDRRYWHTHHINGDKTMNDESNLECLCVCCHSQKDQRHEANFTRKAWQKEVEFFVAKYKDELAAVNSPCLDR
ncbi:HNH endonuclease signature motif containing protein [Marinoscillum sp. MHG1-6]|uniref:HNH endonuclease signature motif containing protein n=1 Tax=Marinoscillum sp. MHG1-6 TaxID=2959627 RepID=UPI002156FE60|nr:HNH endonuclease signature motif containing protein [Marinoscillum sp. MHG1-6]